MLATTLLLEFTMLMKPVELNLTGSLKNIVADVLLLGTSVAPAGGYMETKVGAVVSAVALVEPATAAAKLSPRYPSAAELVEPDKTVKVPTEDAAALLLPARSASRPAGALMV
jgi:septal ring-binding cell division protein DamX